MLTNCSSYPDHHVSMWLNAEGEDELGKDVYFVYLKLHLEDDFYGFNGVQRAECVFLMVQVNGRSFFPVWLF